MQNHVSLLGPSYTCVFLRAISVSEVFVNHLLPSSSHSSIHKSPLIFQFPLMHFLAFPVTNIWKKQHFQFPIDLSHTATDNEMRSQLILGLYPIDVFTYRLVHWTSPHGIFCFSRRPQMFFEMESRINYPQITVLSSVLQLSSCDTRTS